MDKTSPFSVSASETLFWPSYGPLKFGPVGAAPKRAKSTFCPRSPILVCDKKSFTGLSSYPRGGRVVRKNSGRHNINFRETGTSIFFRCYLQGPRRGSSPHRNIFFLAKIQSPWVDPRFKKKSQTRVGRYTEIWPLKVKVNFATRYFTFFGAFQVQFRHFL